MVLTKIEYQWVVKKSEFSIKYNYECLSSPIFSFEFIRKCEWRIDFYPQGKTKSNTNCVDIFLKSLNDFSVEVYFTISISNCKTNKILTTCTGRKEFSPNADAVGFSMINYDLVTNDDIKIVYKINTQYSVPMLKGLINGINEEMKLKLLESQCRLEEFDKFGELLYSGAFSDVIIKTNEKEFKVHKNILASKSSAFNAMLSSNVKENVENIIEIIDIDSVFIEEVLYFMYAEKINQTNNEMKMKIFIAADKYFVGGLKTICIRQLSKNITVKDALEILGFARIYDQEGLFNDCTKFVSNKVPNNQ